MTALPHSRLLALSLSLLVLWAPQAVVASTTSIIKPPASFANAGTASDRWLNNLNSGLSIASREYQPVFVLFTSPGCGWCTRLKKEIFPDPDVVGLLHRFVCVEIDVTENPAVASQFQVRGVPAMRILSASGQIQQSADGFLPPLAFQNFLRSVLDPASVSKPPDSVFTLLKQLDENKLPASDWPNLILAIGNKNTRKLIHGRIFKLNPLPVHSLVAMLSDPRLAVRIGAIEILEEITGDDFDFDPWSDAEANAKPITRWNEWAASPTSTENAGSGTLSAEQLRVYLRDIASNDIERSSRAVRMLQNGGASTLQSLDDFLEKNPLTSPSGKSRIREAKYALVLPSIGNHDPLSLAHQLVFGNLDTRIQAINLLNEGGDAVLPVAVDYLGDNEAMVREASVETLVSVARKEAIPVLEAQLRREKDPNVVFSILRVLGKIPSKKGTEILLSYINDPNEDLAIAAIESLASSLKSDDSRKTSLSQPILTCLSDPRWRVRVAAIDAAGRLQLGDLSQSVVKAVDDPDPFVRTKAVVTLPELFTERGGASKSTLTKEVVAKKLADVYLKDDELKPAVVRGLSKLKSPLPDSFISALNSASPDTIVGIIDALGDFAGEGAAFLRHFAGHSDPDIACASLRLLANPSAESPATYEVIDRALQSGDRNKVMAVLQGLRLNRNQKKQLLAYSKKQARNSSSEILSALKKAFGNDETKPPKGSIQQVARSLENLLKSSSDPEIRIACATFLAPLSNPEALKYLNESLPSLSKHERSVIAESLDDGAPEDARPLLLQLLHDNSEEIRHRASSACLDSGSDPVLFTLPIEDLARTDSPLRPADIFSYRLFSSRDRSPGETEGTTIRQLVADPDPAKSTIGLCLLHGCWDKSDIALVRPLLDSPDPWVRRAAYQVLAFSEPQLFIQNIQRMASDSSENVRLLIPECLENEKNLMLDDTNSDQVSTNRSRGKEPQPNQEILDVLKTLTNDPSNKVRLKAYIRLLYCQQPVDVQTLFETIRSFSDRKAFSSTLTEFFSKNYSRLGQEFAVFLPLLEESGMNDAEKKNLAAHFAAAKKTSVDRFAFVVHKKPAPVIGTFTKASAQSPKKELTSAKVNLVFFYTPGCPDCKKTEKILEELKLQFPGLVVESHNLRIVEAMRLNEALCDRFNISPKLHSISPAIFGAAGAIVKSGLTHSALERLISESIGLPGDWRTPADADLSKAGTAITQRYSTFSFSVVILAGLLDGINPCAFATIIFFISYLQVARRTPRQILQVGIAFVTGVFIAYLVLGLGLVEIVARLAVLRGAAQILNILLGIFALIIMSLSIRDGFLCLQGKLKETMLQLPDYLKSRIHGVIRAGARHSRFVMAAFLSGLIVSCLELACTGQVYAPTILYILKSGRATALGYIFVYNLAFILPLVGVFMVAYAGIQSPALIAFQNRHAALIKFATAGLFFVLFVMLIWGF